MFGSQYCAVVIEMKSEEIAKIAGVSRSTVSRVINNYPNVPAATRERVMKVIREYNYEPNTSARVLAGKGTNTIGLFLFSIHDVKEPYRVYGNNYFAPLIEAFIDIANYRGYYVLVHTIYSPEECWRIRQTFSQKRIDGGVIIGIDKNPELDEIISSLKYPLALVDYDPDEILLMNRADARIAVINADNEGGINACVDYLVSNGHRVIGLMEGRNTTYSGLKRREFFLKRMKSHNLPVRDCHLMKCDFTAKTSAAAVEALLAEKTLPSAIIACNDEMAFAAMETFQHHGIRVPEDISIIGFDDAPTSSIIRPALTTVRVPFYDMAQKALESLSGLIDRSGAGFEQYTMNVELIIRESCTERI